MGYLQDSGIDDDVLVVTEDFDDLMDEDAVVLPESLKGGVRHLRSLSLLPGYLKSSQCKCYTRATGVSPAVRPCILHLRSSCKLYVTPCLSERTRQGVYLQRKIRCRITVG